jgi:hypothetical protein
LIPRKAKRAPKSSDRKEETMNAMIRPVATALGALSLAVVAVITVTATAATAMAGEMTGGTPAPMATPASALTAGAGWQ